MAKGTKTGGKDFKKGWKGGPGRPKVPEDLKEVRKITNTSLETKLHEFLTMSAQELSGVKQNPKSSMLELMIHSIVVNAVNRGDQQRMGFLMDRLLGKVKDQIEVETYTRPLRELSNDELLKQLPEAIQLLKEKK